MWLVWTGGDDRFWDRLTHDTFGAFDLLKTISSHPEPERTVAATAGTIWASPTSPASTRRRDPTRRTSGCGSTSGAPIVLPIPSPTSRNIPASPSARAGKNMPVGSYYGEPTGIMGPAPVPQPRLRRGGSQDQVGSGSGSTPTRNYYNDKDLVRPYRVGMSCAFCHVGPSPIAPPGGPRVTPSGRTSTRRSAHSISGSTEFRLGGQPPPTTCTSWFTPNVPERWIPRWFRPTTSTTRAR